MPLETRKQIEDKLARALEYLQHGQQRIAHQEQIISARIKGGYPVGEAERVLAGFQATQRCFEHYVNTLRAELAELDPPSH